VQGVKGEEEGRQSAWPASTGGALEEAKEQQGAEGVQEHVREVKGSRAQAEKLSIEHEREPGEGKPVGVGC
jgi:hypothetical protein